MFKWFLDLLFPKFCLGCGREGQYICQDCQVFLSEVDPILGGPTSPKIKGEVGPLNIVSVWEYEGLMEKIIWQIKYRGCYHAIDELVEKTMAKIELNLPDDTLITFVPMHKKREKERGFNQAKLIAKALEKIIGHQALNMLEKVIDNRSQVGLGPEERIENVRGVFRATPDVRLTSEVNATTTSEVVTSGVAGNVLLVDDVYTTGATMNECIKTLKKAGVKNVWGFTLARKLSL